MNPEGRVCTKCGKFKPWSGFYQNSKGKNGRQSKCVLCYAKRTRETKDDRLRLLYGITEVDYENKLKEQDGVCKICKRPPGSRPLSVDHCHKTGRIRGLLCSSCNMALGLFGDSIQNLRAATEYLET